MPNSNWIKKSFLKLIATLLNVQPKSLVRALKQTLINHIRQHYCVLVLLGQVHLNKLTGLHKFFSEAGKRMPVSVLNHNRWTLANGLDSSLHNLKWVRISVKNALFHRLDSQIFKNQFVEYGVRNRWIGSLPFRFGCSVPRNKNKYTQSYNCLQFECAMTQQIRLKHGVWVVFFIRLATCCPQRNFLLFGQRFNKQKVNNGCLRMSVKLDNTL